MTTYNTGNPVGSSDPRDLYDNAENLDEFSNSGKFRYDDRLGVSRRTLAGINQIAAGYNPRGEFVTGTAYNVNDLYIATAGFYVGAIIQVIQDHTSTATDSDIASGYVTLHQPHNYVASVETIADLRALEPLFDGQQVSLSGYHSTAVPEQPKGGGIFTAKYGNYSAEVSSDTLTGIYVAFPSDPSGATGAWVRCCDMSRLRPEFFGAKPDDASINDLQAIRAALDITDIGGSVILSSGTYILATEDLSALEITRNVSIVGVGSRSVLRVDTSNNLCDAIVINITDNDGLGDVRGFSLTGISVFFGIGTGGRHTISLPSGLVLVGCFISRNNLTARGINGGRCLYIPPGQSNFTHSEFSYNQCSHPIEVSCGDANRFVNNNVFCETGFSFIFDLEFGVRNNTVKDNTLVSRDGAVHIINGGEVRIENNQIEQYQPYGENQSNPSCSVYLEGRDRIISNTVIEKNNFGGGTNVDYSIYIDNAQHSVITKNNFIATDVDDIYTTPNSKYNILKFDNTVRGSISDPRPDTYFKLRIDNNSPINIQMPFNLAGQNGWNNNTIVTFEDGYTGFLETWSGGATLAGTAIATIPIGARPDNTLYAMTTIDLSGDVGKISINGASGVISPIVNLPSNSSVRVESRYKTPIQSSDF